MAKPKFDEVVEIKPFDPVTATDKTVSANRHGTFSKSTAYEGWHRSIFPLAWFDSSTERAVANMIDSDDSVDWWVRLHIGDLPILRNSADQWYHPDLLVIEKDRTHWIVEVKMNKEMDSPDVQASVTLPSAGRTT